MPPHDFSAVILASPFCNDLPDVISYGSSHMELAEVVTGLAHSAAPVRLHQLRNATRHFSLYLGHDFKYLDRSHPQAAIVPSDVEFQMSLKKMSLHPVLGVRLKASGDSMRLLEQVQKNDKSAACKTVPPEDEKTGSGRADLGIQCRLRIEFLVPPGVFVDPFELRRAQNSRRQQQKAAAAAAASGLGYFNDSILLLVAGNVDVEGRASNASWNQWLSIPVPKKKPAISIAAALEKKVFCHEKKVKAEDLASGCDQSPHNLDFEIDIPLHTRVPDAHRQQGHKPGFNVVFERSTRSDEEPLHKNGYERVQLRPARLVKWCVVSESSREAPGYFATATELASAKMVDADTDAFQSYINIFVPVPYESDREVVTFVTMLVVLTGFYVIAKEALKKLS